MTNVTSFVFFLVFVLFCVGGYLAHLVSSRPSGCRASLDLAGLTAVVGRGGQVNDGRVEWPL